MSRLDSEGFLRRWSRLKEEVKSEAPAPPAPQPAREADAEPPVLPPLDELTAESDFRPFFHPKVEETLRRAALKKLFSDPHFNVIDGLDVYIEDYSKTEPLTPGMLESLEQAQKILAWARESQGAPAAAGEAPVTPLGGEEVVAAAGQPGDAQRFETDAPAVVTADGAASAPAKLSDST